MKPQEKEASEWMALALTHKKYKMTPTPWENDDDDRIIKGRPMHSDSGLQSEVIVKCTKASDAEAIVSAINNTYGKGIKPEAVEEMYTALLELAKAYASTCHQHYMNAEKHPVFTNARIALKKNERFFADLPREL
jgi:hypothetical protein